MTETPPAPRDTARLQRLGRFLEMDPGNPVLLRDYALEASRAGEAEAAVAALRQLLPMPAAEPQDACLLAATLRAQGDAAEAEQIVTDAITRWPGQDELAIEQAKLLFAQRDFDAALAALPQESADPLLAGEACALRIQLLHHLGRLDEARALAQAFAAQHHEDPRVAASSIPVLLDSYRFDEAVALARALTGSGIDAYQACEALAADALEQGDPAEASNWTARALAHRQDDGRIWLMEGMARMRAGQLDDAGRALDEAVALLPGHAGSHLARGWLHLLANQRTLARECFERAVQASPSFSEGHGSLAVVEAMEGRAEQAGELVRKAQRLDAACATAQYARALLGGADARQVNQLAEAVLTHVRTGRR